MLENFTAEQMNRAFDEIFRQTDRSSAIVSGSMLEELLERILRAFLMEHEKEYEDRKALFRIMDFKSKIILSYYLGLINQSEFKDLMLIRKIRNEFAHTFEEINFETQKIKDNCVNLKTFINTKPPIDKIKDIKTFFSVNVTLLSSMLFLKLDKIKRLSFYKYEVN